MSRRKRPDSDFSAELQAHLDLEKDRLMAEGMTEEEAEITAKRSLGNRTSAREHFYESSRWVWLENLTQDTRQALRRLRKAPAFSVTAILTLALGIGATTSIFTLVHEVLLKSLPVSNPKQLIRLGKTTHCCVWGGYSQSDEFSIVSYDLYKHFRDNTKGFAELAAFQGGRTTLGVRRANSPLAAEGFKGEFVSGNYFSMFGINAYAGRTLTPKDDEIGAPPVAVLSYRLWQQKYGQDPSVIGGAFLFNGISFNVVGVAPPGFFGDRLRNNPPDIYLPLATEPVVQSVSSLYHQPDSNWLDVIGRVDGSTPVESIEAQMRVELQQWLRAHESLMSKNDRTVISKQTLYLSPGGAGIIEMREAYEEWLHILMTVSGFVLLIVCANVANLMLVRGMERRQQTSLIMALGAKPSRLIRQALIESVLLSLFGGAAGLAVAYSGARLILNLAFQEVSTSPINVSPSPVVLAFAFGVALITGIVFGIAPAWMALRADPIEALRGASRSTRKAGSLPRKTLVILQAALSLVLLSAAGLLTEALLKLERQDFGFEQKNRIIVNFDPLLAGYKPAQLDGLYQRIRDSIAAIPGVASVALCQYSPQSGDSWNDRIYVDGKPVPGPNEDNSSHWDRISSGYFDTVGTPVLKGRAITDQDTQNTRHVAVVNEAFARKFFPDQDPIGKHFGKSDPKTSREYEIVGVVKDARYLTYNLRRPIGAFVFLPQQQTAAHETPMGTMGETRSHYFADIVIRLQPGAVLNESQVRSVLAGVDANMPMMGMRSLSDQVSSNFNQQRLIARLTSLFGFLALILASIGLYGVTAYNVGSRTNEIGLRIALGAERGNVLALILRGALMMIAIGLLLGVPLALATGKFLQNQLYGVNQYDPLVLVTATLVLGFSALIAALIPALRASSISPLQALRAE